MTMKNLLTLLCLLLLVATSCGPNGPKSGKSDLAVGQNTGTPLADSGATAPELLDTGSADARYEAVRERLKNKAEQLLLSREPKQVRINGTILGGVGMSITLNKLGGESNYEPLVTTIINEDNYFELSTNSNQEQIYSLSTDSGNIVLFLDNGNYDLKANINDLSKFQVNAPMSYKVQELFLILETFNERYEKLSKRQDKYAKAKKAWKVQRMLDSMPYYNNLIEQERAKALKNFIDNNRNSPLAAEAANRLDFLKHTNYVEALYDELVKKYPYSSYVKNLGMKLIRYLPMALGKNAPELVMPSADGTNYRLSSLKGKYVLVLLTVGYSPQCVAEANALTDIYNIYHNRGFEIYNVALDETEDDLKAWLASTQAPWIVVCDQLGTKSSVFDHYMAYEYPMSYLIDPDGKLVEKFMEAGELKAFLSANLPK